MLSSFLKSRKSHERKKVFVSAKGAAGGAMILAANKAELVPGLFDYKDSKESWKGNYYKEHYCEVHDSDCDTSQ